MQGHIESVRAFTRFYTRQVELLDEGLLRSAFRLTQARVLYELAHREGASASDLVQDLGIDAGYLSRILARFEADGLVRRAGSPEDGRRSMLALTPAGRAAFAPLDHGSREQVARWLEPLPAADRLRLVDAMTTIERLLGARDADTTDVVLRDLEVGDIGFIARRQGMLYAAEYGWDITYEALVAEILAGFARSYDRTRERAWIAERGGEIVGSVFLVRVSDEVAKLRLLYVEPAARGTGLGRRLVRDCVGHARERGYRALTLWTNDCLLAARRIYETEGFALDHAEPHHSFGHDLVGETWSLAL